MPPNCYNLIGLFIYCNAILHMGFYFVIMTVACCKFKIHVDFLGVDSLPGAITIIA